MHSGNLVDSVNDTETKYCMWFEEQQWLRKHEDADSDPNTMRERLLRATRVLHDPGKFHSAIASGEIALHSPFSPPPPLISASHQPRAPTP